MGILPKTSRKFTKYEPGQALLIVLLSMAVILTVVLSVTSRSVVDVTTTIYQEDALRAFSAAEAGVEQALLKQTNVSDVIDSNSNITFNTQIGTPALGNIYNYPGALSSGEIATIWFVSHNNTTNALTCTSGTCTRANQLNICFGNDPANPPAVEVSIYYDSSQLSFGSPNNFTNLKVVRTTRDPLGSRQIQNKFSAGASGCPFGNYSFQSGSVSLSSLIPRPPNTNCDVNNANCLVMATIRILYNSSPQPIGIRATGGSPNFPAQGFQIDSTGTSGESVRNLSVNRTYPEPQSVFDSAVFSRNALTKP